MPRLFISVALLVGLLFNRVQPVDDVTGAWRGMVEHNGEHAEMVVEFERRGDKILTLISSPAINAWRFPFAFAERTGNRITAGGAVFVFDPAAQTLTTTLPPDLAPKYHLSATFHRAGPIVPAERRPIDAPARQPEWTLNLGAPIWSDVAIDGDTVVVGADDGRLHAVDAESGRERWTFTTGGAIRARAAFVDHDIVIQADDGVLYRIDGQRGTAKWRVPIAKPRTRVALDAPSSRYENVASGVTAQGSRLYVGTHEGRVLAIDARNGKSIWEFKTAEAIVATPIVARGKLYVGSFDGNLYALDASTGALLWKHDTGGAVTSAVAVRGSQVLVGSRSFDLESLDAARGTPVWTKYFWFSWVESPATVLGSLAYIGSSDAAKVSAIDGATGRAIWATDVLGSAWGQPAVTESTVYEGVAGVLNYIAPHRGSLVALDRASGRVVWWYPARPPDPAPSGVMPYGFAGSVAVGAKLVFAGGLDGVLYAFSR